MSQDIPLVTVAAFFQKDPQSLVVHTGVGHDSLEALKGKPMRVPTAGALGMRDGAPLTQAPHKLLNRFRPVGNFTFAAGFLPTGFGHRHRNRFLVDIQAHIRGVNFLPG